MENLNKIEHLHPSKKEIKQMAAKEAEKYLESGKDVLQDFIKARRIIDYLTEFCGSLKEAVVNEREQYDKREKLTVCGATVSVSETGVRYDYSVCNDPEWLDLNNQIKALTGQLKEREKFLKGINGSETKFDEDSGEVYKLFAPKKTSTTAPKIEY
jgi:hypothetical protein